MRGISLGFVVVLAACAADVGGVEVEEDGENDAFFVGPAADGIIREDSAGACAVLRVVNESTTAVLRDEVRLTSRVATNIVRRRPFETIASLDAVPYVGPVALVRLLDYAHSNEITCEDAPTEPAECNGDGGTFDGVRFTSAQECHAVDFLNRARWSEMGALPDAARSIAYDCWPAGTNDEPNAIDCGYRSSQWENLEQFANAPGIGATTINALKAAAPGWTENGLRYDTVASVWTNRAALRDAPVSLDSVFVTRRLPDEEGFSTYYCVELRDSPTAPNFIAACVQWINADSAPECATATCAESMVGQWLQLRGTVRRSSAQPGGYKINLAKNFPDPGDPSIPRMGEIVDPTCHESWCVTATTGAPTGRYAHVSAWTGTELIVWGGLAQNDTTGTEATNTGALYDPATRRWRAMSMTGAPSARINASAVWTGTELVVWGGSLYGMSTETTALRTGARYNPRTNTWRSMSTTSAPPASADAGAVWTGTEMVVWGGNDGNAAIATGGRYNPTTNTWRSITRTGAPSARSTSNNFVWTGTEAITWSGWDYSTIVSDGAAYNPSTNRWRTISSVDAPTPRYFATMVWAGDKLIVWGGNVAYTVNDGAIYYPDSDTWVPMFATNAPLAREGARGVWAGDRLVVFGGANGLGATYGLGGVYIPEGDVWEELSAVASPRPRTHATFVLAGSSFLVWGGLYRGREHLNDGGSVSFCSTDVSLAGEDCGGLGYTRDDCLMEWLASHNAQACETELSFRMYDDT